MSGMIKNVIRRAVVDAAWKTDCKSGFSAQCLSMRLNDVPGLKDNIMFVSGDGGEMATTVVINLPSKWIGWSSIKP